MTKNLFYQAVGKVLLGIFTAALLLFWPAGTVRYWNGWLFMGILFIPMVFAGVVLMLKNPGLLQKRLHMREQQAEQVLVIVLSGLMFVLGFVLAGWNFRFQWLVQIGRAHV